MAQKTILQSKSAHRAGVNLHSPPAITTPAPPCDLKLVEAVATPK